mmetsp:Transcript_27981/g.56165  ORF Transcript_27981/g.56165 Transcript_27981/m.56165 type:complete len:337 (+) Transcript_27981:26-1036(+)
MLAGCWLPEGPTCYYELIMNNHMILLCHAVGPIYITLTAAALLSIVSPALNSLSSHGKTRLLSNKCHGNNNHESVCCSLYQRIRNFVLHSNYLSVDKGRFIDFYAVGSIITTITIIFNYLKWSGINTTTITEHKHWLPAYLLLIHLVRRFYECMWVQKSVSTSRMHIAGYLLGVIHYLCLPFVFIPINQELEQKSSSIVESFIVSMGCLYFQYQQHLHHVILGNLRPNKTTSSTGEINSYRIPKGGWFDFVSCPHYLAEIMIYFMLAVLIQIQTDTAMVQDEESGILYQIHAQKHFIVLIWVSTNLSISAEKTHAWYISTFGKAYPRRKRLIPFLW